MSVLKRSLYRFGTIQYDLSTRTFLVGVLNVTPDSFSDGGKFFDRKRAIEHGLRMVEEGADFIDVGGESTRPGSEPIPVDEELRRVLPVIEGLAAKVTVPISIDTYKAAVAKRALEAGATIVNDITGLRFDPEMVHVIVECNASVIIMHMQGTPKTMQQNPVYGEVVSEVRTFLSERAAFAEEQGINQILIDPGIGFGKRLEHNLEIFRRLNEFTVLGYPLLIGPSRKSFIGTILNLPVDSRFEGTAAAVAVSILNGANVVRVHDVQAMKRVSMVVDAIKRGAIESALV